MPKSWVWLEPPGLGARRTFQVVPFHCSINARSVRELTCPYSPTAQALQSEMAATPLSWFGPDPRFAGCMPQLGRQCAAEAGAAATRFAPAAITPTAITGPSRLIGEDARIFSSTAARMSGPLFR